MRKLVECVPNFSEGRDRTVIDAIAEAIRRDPRARVVLPGGREVVPAEVIVFPAAEAASHSVNVRVRGILDTDRTRVIATRIEFVGS